MNIAFHSKTPTAIPLAAAVPAKPTKCPEPIFDEKSDPATGMKNIVLEQGSEIYDLRKTGV